MAPTKNLNISPSKLERVVLCPGSARMTADLPRKDSDAAKRGRALHDAMALLFQAGAAAALPTIRKNIETNPLCKPGDFDQVKFAYECGMELMPADPDTQVVIEKPLSIAWMGLSGGKPDLLLISPKFKQAVLVDWKFGVGSVEDPATNWQMRAYGAGTISTFPTYGLEAIEPAIIQPGAFKKDDSVRSHVWKKDELRTFAAEIQGHVAAANKPDAPLVAGPVQCRWCDAKDTCPAYKAYADAKAKAKEDNLQMELNGISTVGTPIIVEPEEQLTFPVVVINAETIGMAEERKKLALEMRVVDQLTANAAGALSKDIRSLANLIDKQRETVKKPFLELGRRIDSEAKKAMTPLAEAAAHLDGLVAGYLQKIREEQARAKAEEERRQREAAEAARKAQEEAAKKAAEAEEAERRAGELKTKAAREKAEAAAAKARQEAEEAERARQAEEAKRLQAEADRRAAEAAAQAPAEAPKVQGFRGTKVTTWEIPDFSKIPPELLATVLIPNAKVIDTMIKTGVLTAEKHGAWIQITVSDGLARSR